MAEEQLSKKELRAQKHAEKAEKKAEEARKAKRESFLQNILIWGFVAILGAGLVLFVGSVLTGDDSEGAVTEFEMPVDVESEWIKGNPEAEVTVIEYADFQCPGCASVYPVVNSLLEDYGSDLRFVYRHFPLAFHGNAVPAARAAEAAGEQGAFFEMHDLLFSNQNEWSSVGNPDDIFLSYAEELELDLVAFEAAYESDETLARVEEDRETGREFVITGTPTFFVNGKLVRFTNSYVPLVEAVEEAIAEAQAEEDTSLDETEEVDSSSEIEE
ncbi:MAG: thioredoxin domain-containing protein [Candidatus Paceibacterota bacterium]